MGPNVSIHKGKFHVAHEGAHCFNETSTSIIIRSSLLYCVIQFSHLPLVRETEGLLCTGLRIGLKLYLLFY